MAAMRAPVLAEVIPLRRGKGRPAAAIEALRDALDELTAHNAEALTLVDILRPLVDRMHLVARECGPVAMQTVMAMAAHLDHYERRHLDDGPLDAA